jgi:glucose-1-phosphate adenylyltransferase
MLDHCMIGIRSIIGSGVRMRRTVMMGADFYDEGTIEVANYEPVPEGAPPMGIGDDCVIENAIIDKNARIGDNCVISPAGKPENADHPLYYIRDGIVIIPKNGTVPHGTVI